MSALKRTTGSTLLARKPANLLKEAAFKWQVLLVESIGQGRCGYRYRGGTPLVAFRSSSTRQNDFQADQGESMQKLYRHFREFFQMCVARLNSSNVAKA